MHLVYSDNYNFDVPMLGSLYWFDVVEFPPVAMLFGAAPTR
jgi:hypothetical protein